VDHTIDTECLHYERHCNTRWAFSFLLISQKVLLRARSTDLRSGLAAKPNVIRYGFEPHPPILGFAGQPDLTLLGSAGPPDIINFIFCLLDFFSFLLINFFHTVKRE